MCNLQRAPNSKAAEISDFLLYDRPPTSEQTPEDLAAYIQVINGAYGGKVIIKTFGEDGEKEVAN